MNKFKNSKYYTFILWSLLGLFFLFSLFSFVFFPTIPRFSLFCAVIFVLILGTLITHYRKNISSRTAAFGTYSFLLSLIVLGIIGIVNYFAFKNPVQWDLTSNKIHTLSDQTQKILKNLDKNVTASFFGSFPAPEEITSILNNYKSLSSHFKVEYSDSKKEIELMQIAGIKKENSLYLHLDQEGANNSAVLEEVNEEKLTNALIKILKEKKQTLCIISGHGEKDFEDSSSPKGYGAAKKGLESQAYSVNTINLIQEGKIPSTCDGIAIIGPEKPFFEPEAKIIDSYLQAGGKALFAFDIIIKGNETSPHLIKLLKNWHIDVFHKLLIDLNPLAQLMGGSPLVPLLRTFSPEHPITKDFKTQVAFPVTRALDIIPANLPKSLKISWLAKTTQYSWAESELNTLDKKQPKFDDNSADIKGPIAVAIAAEGSLDETKEKKKDQDKTRIVVFGTSMFANNQFSNNAGNLDFFINSINWILKDESSISIRKNEEDPAKIVMTGQDARSIFWISVIFLPLSIAAAGIGMWIRRRRL